MAEQTFEQFVERLLSILKERRKELGLTQGEVGERIGKPQSAVARLESGKIKDPHISMIYQFCHALDINMSEAFAIDCTQNKITQGLSAETYARTQSLRLQVPLGDADRVRAITTILDGVELLLR